MADTDEVTGFDALGLAEPQFAGLALWRVLLRIFRHLVPRLLRILRPGYDPREVPDPAWATQWRSRFGNGETGLGQLDTRRLDTPTPMEAAA